MQPVKRKSLVWFFFKTSDDNKFATCTLCKLVIKYFGGTSNLNQHLKRKHPITFQRKINEGQVYCGTEDDGTITNDGEIQEVTIQDEPFFTSSCPIKTEVTPRIKRTKREEKQDEILMARQMLSNEDECSITAKCYALKLKKMSPMQRILADKLINDVLLEGQLGTLTRESNIVIHPKIQNLNSPLTSLPLISSDDDGIILTSQD